MIGAERYFDRFARAYDRRYDHELREWLLRPGVARARHAAVALVHERPGASVLDAGCGPGRVGEAVLAAGASRYVGIDLSGEMISLARERLERFGPRVTLIRADVAKEVPGEPFDVVLALGLFDYVADPVAALTRLGNCCGDALLATFPGHSPARDRLRRVVYGRYGCVLEQFSRARVDEVLARAGLDGADVSTSRSGVRVTWRNR